MFLMIGISQGKKILSYMGQILCRSCGRMSGCQVFMVYTYLSIFLIPTFRWGRHYYVKMNCCGRIYELDRDKGRAIARGEQVSIQPQDLHDTGRGNAPQNEYGAPGYGGGAGSAYSGYGRGFRPEDHESGQPRRPQRCPACGYMVPAEFNYCPRCGQRIH